MGLTRSIEEETVALFFTDLRPVNQLPNRVGRLCRAVIALVFIAALSARAAAQDKTPPAKSEPKADERHKGNRCQR